MNVEMRIHILRKFSTHLLIHMHQKKKIALFLNHTISKSLQYRVISVSIMLVTSHLIMQKCLACMYSNFICGGH